jgi:FemAB-related protein (PEP-CTERM system-associated)
LSGTGFSIRPAPEEESAARDAFVLAHPRGNFFHLSGWERTVGKVLGHSRVDFHAWRGNELAGILPLMRCKGLLGGASLISVPYAVYGGAIGTDREVEHALVGAAAEKARAESVGRLELRCLEDPGLELAASDLYATFVRDLPAGPEEVAARMPKRARAEARKARERHGLELSEGAWFLEDLIRLFQRNKRDLGSPALPARWFRTLARELAPRVFVHLVRRGEEPLAAVMSFAFRDTLLAYYSGTARDADREYSASNFMYLALQEWAVRQGFRRFDFGRSRRDSGAFQFKVHQGFEPQPLHYRFLLVRDRALPSLHPSNPRTRLLREAWSRLPPWLAERLATSASRFLP